MEVKTKYDVGDIIVYDIPKRRHIANTCNCCGGKGYIIGEDRQEYKCPSCHGVGAIDRWENYDNEVTGKIEDIEIHQYLQEDYCKKNVIRYKVARANDKWWIEHDYVNEEQIKASLAN